MTKRRRTIFYCHGFDKRGPRFFWLWQKRGARQMHQRFGRTIRVGALNGPEWTLETDEMVSTFVFCDWTDIIADRFDQPVWRRLLELPRLGFSALRQGFFGKVARTDWSAGLLLIWGFMPFFVATLTTLAVALIDLRSIWVVLPVWVALIWLLRRYDNRLGMAYIAHIAWAARRLALQDHAGLEARIARFEERIATTPTDEEILIVGHSIGATVALRLFDTAPADARLLTVGQSVPLVSLQAEAGQLRQVLARAKDDSRVWIDVSARKDMLAFLAQDPSDGGADCVTVNFKRAFGAARVAALRWRGFAMHFLYFSANLHDGQAWNWYDILAGPTPIESRFKGARRRSGKGERRLLF